MTQASTRIRPRERDAVLQSLRAGVVPRSGQAHIQVGRAAEVQALIADITRIADGGAGSRFVIGEYGSGKTFFLHLVQLAGLRVPLCAHRAAWHGHLSSLVLHPPIWIPWRWVAILMIR